MFASVVLPVPSAPVGAEYGPETVGLPAGTVYELSSVVPEAVGVVFSAEAGPVGEPLGCSGAYGEDGWADGCWGEGAEADTLGCLGMYGDDAWPDGCCGEAGTVGEPEGCS